MAAITVPNQAVPYVLFQRTGYLIGTKIPVFNRLFRWLPYNQYVLLEARLFRSRIKRCYSTDMAQEYARIKEHLPSRAFRILDIGCGVAGIDVFLNRHYETSHPEFFLIDRSETAARVYYDFKQSGAFYNSLDVAVDLMSSNGVPLERIHVQEADQGRVMFPAPSYDLIISLISWGFHYPVSAYLDAVRERLSRDGVLILDIRRDSGGVEAIEEAFGDVREIFGAEKYVRLAARR